MGFSLKNALAGVGIGGLLGGSQGASIGGVVSGLGGGLKGIVGSLRGKRDQTTTSSIPEWQIPYVMAGLEQAKGRLGAEAMSPEEAELLGQMGKPTEAYGLLRGQLTGGPNQYLDPMYDQAASAVTRNFREAVQPGIAARFSGAGRLSSPAEAATQYSAERSLGDSLGGMAANIYGQGQQQYTQNLLAANALEQGNLENRLSAARMIREAPDERLRKYMQSISGNYGGTQTTPQSRNRLAGILGGGMSGASLFPGNPLLGGLGGALLGGLG